VCGIFLTAVLTFFIVDSVDAAETVNINTADISTLAAELVGVGPQLARRIVEFRERYGDFETVEAHQRCSGYWRGVTGKKRR
jgi:competence protein ComEA